MPKVVALPLPGRCRQRAKEPLQTLLQVGFQEVLHVISGTMTANYAQTELLCRVQDDDEDDTSSPVDEVDPKSGLTWQRARAEAKRSGPNRVTPPIDCPPWVCCLLPCILSTNTMRRYHSSIPENALVLREREWTDVDAVSLVVSDIIQLSRGDVAPADLAVVDCSRDSCRANSASKTLVAQATISLSTRWLPSDASREKPSSIVLNRAGGARRRAHANSTRAQGQGPAFRTVHFGRGHSCRCGHRRRYRPRSQHVCPSFLDPREVDPGRRRAGTWPPRA